MNDIQEIEVDINWVEFAKLPNTSTSMATMWAVSKLKKAGIPINGLFIFRGVEEGVLSTWRDPVTPSIQHFRWTSK